jgi:hypothetical protein
LTYIPYPTPNLPYISKNWGLAQMCDGITTLGAYSLQSPDHERIAYTNYADDLRWLSADPYMPAQLKEQLKIKLACGTLSAQEHAFIAFDFPAKQDEELRQAARSHLKSSPQIVPRMMHCAQEYGRVTHSITLDDHHPGHSYRATAILTDLHNVRAAANAMHRSEKTATGMALFNALGEYQKFDPQTVPAYTQTLFSPREALKKHIAQYGGPTGVDVWNPQEVAAVIGARHQAEFHGKLFYPDPVEALVRAYDMLRPKWQISKDAIGYICTGMSVERKKDGDTDAYQLNARGPNQHAARRAAARVILNYVGATNLNLLK